MLKNTFIKVNNHSHGNRIVEAFLKLGAKNSRDLIKGCVGQYVGVITDTLTCIPAKDLLTLKGTITITNLEELESKFKDVYKPRMANLSEYKDGFADGFKTGFEMSK